MNPLSGFSDWALALLPRMFLYPGGLALAAAFLIALFASHLATGSTGTPSLRKVLRLVARANIPGLACAWAGLAILPLPGVAPLPFPVDHFALVAITTISLLFDLALTGEDSASELWHTLPIVLALMSPIASQRVALLPRCPR